MSKRDKKRMPSGDEYGGGGFLTSMRGGFKNLAGVSFDRGAGHAREPQGHGGTAPGYR